MATESIISPSSVAQGVVLDGLKGSVQGVGRFIAGLGDLAAANSAPMKTERLNKGHVDRESMSSASTYSTTTTRFSQSSESSMEAFDDGVEGPQNSADHSTIAIKPARGSSLRQAPAAMVDGTSSSSTPPPTRLARESNNRNKTSLQEDSSVSILSAVHVEPMLIQSPSSIPEHVRTKEFTLSFPPPASIPGLSTLSSSVAVPPLTSWVGSVGKKFGEFQKTQKRASVLLADVSNSFFAAIASPPISSSVSTSPHPDNSSQMVSGPILSTITSRSRTSLLDDDEDENGMVGDVAQRLSNVAPLTPDRSPIQTLMPQTSDLTKNACPALIEEDEEDWNW